MQVRTQLFRWGGGGADLPRHTPWACVTHLSTYSHAHTPERSLHTPQACFFVSLFSFVSERLIKWIVQTIKQYEYRQYSSSFYKTDKFTSKKLYVVLNEYEICLKMLEMAILEPHIFKTFWGNMPQDPPRKLAPSALVVSPPPLKVLDPLELSHAQQFFNLGISGGEGGGGGVLWAWGNLMSAILKICISVILYLRWLNTVLSIFEE